VKKGSFLIILILAVFLMPAMALATDTRDAKDKALTAPGTSQDSSMEKLLGEDQGVVEKDSLTASEIKTAPIATVSDTAGEKKLVPGKKSKAIQAKTSTSTTFEVQVNRDDEVSTRTETFSALNPAEMQRRWKALFSKEITPDSIAYTVKSGDSLYVLAKKNHTTVDFIKKINGLKSDSLYPKMKLKIHTAPFSIQIDKSKNTLVLYSNGEAVKKYSVATGKKNCTPAGEFKITDKLVNPTWFKTGAILPPGSPENALGTRWMGFDKPAYGIHGTIEPKSIGTQASEGCIRMLNEEVEELYSIVPIGTQVTIQD
jgi:lipoprotein-anchoring transpeptidase ErfK/SrfK